MGEKRLAPLAMWLAAPLEAEVSAAVERLRRAPDVAGVALMPDVHLANDVCVGTVLATSDLLYPQAVGGDIGCGMLAVAFDAGADLLRDAGSAGRILARLNEVVPKVRRHRRHVAPWPTELSVGALGHPELEGLCRDEGVLQFGTLGSGNHFIELQEDEADGRLWLMIHSGSRVMGQAIRDHHMARAMAVGSGLKALSASDDSTGGVYLRHVEWARGYAAGNRRAMAEDVAAVVRQIGGVRACWETLVNVDHNHIVRERHGAQTQWVHRKGAMAAGAGVPGLLPGSMATSSFHVEGRGCAAAYGSSAHGAGRAMSREKARKAVAERDLHRQMGGVWYDYRMAADLREEAPSAYKDVDAVLRAQRELVKVVRTMRPLLNYKGH